MKLFTKICLIAAAVALGLGILGVCIGLVMGADVRDLNELGIYISPHQKVAVSGVITEVEEEIREEAGEIVEDMVEESFHVYHDEGLEQEEHSTKHDYRAEEEHITSHDYRPQDEDRNDFSYDLKGIERLDVEVQNAEITIFATEDADYILYYSDRNKDIAKVEGNSLKLEDHTNRSDKIELEIHVPIGVLKEIEIEVAAGNVSADKMIADSVTIEVDAASVQMDELIVTREADLQVEAGKIVVGYYDGPRLDVDCAVGSIMVVCEGNEFDYNYEMECGMGRIVFGAESYSWIGEKIRHQNERSKMIEADCDLGEIILEFPNSL